ncbi:MAG: TlpA family protein disulfide reductase [Saprospiraceae bacterium]|nr:TlpA family protein disulfide reductase [Saprospiraceae bacterium]NNK89983.1 TlpA family protein disulfide reductase [Saprospiraceae bacterium]
MNIIEDFEDMADIFEYDNDTTYLVNFWATWCGPCVKELPYIEEVKSKLSDEKFKLIYVSLDFKKHIETRLLPFLDTHKMTSDMYVLLDSDANSWIDKVDSGWSGSIPFSVVYKGEEKHTFEQQFHSTEELLNIIKPLIH